MLSKEDIAELARTLKDNWPLIDRRSDFYIDPKEHYDQHQQIARFLNAWESAGNVVLKTIIALVVAAILALSAIGTKFGK